MNCLVKSVQTYLLWVAFIGLGSSPSDGTHGRFGVLANAWKETVRDAVADIAANMASAKVKVRRAIDRRTSDPTERKRLFTALKADQWAADPFLARQMRKHWKRGKNRTHDQIVVRADQHNTTVDGSGRPWLAIPGLERYLGYVKRDRQAARHRSQVRSEIFTAVHRVVDKAATVVAEEFTKTFAGRKSLGRNINRRLAAWTKGVTAEALASGSERRGSALVHVNAAYTSQACHRCGRLGRRDGDRLHCTACGVVWQADVNAAINILQRAGDPDIALHTPHQRVKQILRERTDRHRTRLPVQDCSPTNIGRRANYPNCSAMSNK